MQIFATRAEKLVSEVHARGAILIFRRSHIISMTYLHGVTDERPETLPPTPHIPRSSTEPSLSQVELRESGLRSLKNLSGKEARLAFADINADKGVETIERCTASNPRHTPHFYEVDLVDISATQAVVRQAQSDLGGLTVLVNNAANDERHTWEGLSADDWDDRDEHEPAALLLHDSSRST